MTIVASPETVLRRRRASRCHAGVEQRPLPARERESPRRVAARREPGAELDSGIDPPARPPARGRRRGRRRRGSPARDARAPTRRSPAGRARTAPSRARGTRSDAAATRAGRGRRASRPPSSSAAESGSVRSWTERVEQARIGRDEQPCPTGTAEPRAEERRDERRRATSETRPTAEQRRGRGSCLSGAQRASRASRATGGRSGTTRCRRTDERRRSRSDRRRSPSRTDRRRRRSSRRAKCRDRVPALRRPCRCSTSTRGSAVRLQPPGGATGIRREQRGDERGSARGRDEPSGWRCLRPFRARMVERSCAARSPEVSIVMPVFNERARLGTRHRRRARRERRRRATSCSSSTTARPTARWTSSATATGRPRCGSSITSAIAGRALRSARRSPKHAASVHDHHGRRPRVRAGGHSRAARPVSARATRRPSSARVASSPTRPTASGTSSGTAR